MPKEGLKFTIHLVFESLIQGITGETLRSFLILITSTFTSNDYLIRICQLPTTKVVSLRFKLQHPLADRNRLVDISPPTNIHCRVQISVLRIPTGPTPELRLTNPTTLIDVPTPGTPPTRIPRINHQNGHTCKLRLILNEVS